ncbi:hypothetical protein M513_03214 [Trichuris suis]|uniref:Uncharacterized protein n=1 Tax=Trichuris suis TaxID=68888 RepID=A0A085MEX9_9BILA|nr:hypothetical protein M513_14035 [Trichuris suis]KFD55775.1 hypothetical protein M513_03214 [Trichuris suis]
MAKLHYAFIAFLLVLPLYLCNAHSRHHSRESYPRPAPPRPHVHHPPTPHLLPPSHHHPVLHGPHVIPGNSHGPLPHHPVPPHSHHRSPSVSFEVGSSHGHGGLRVRLR